MPNLSKTLDCRLGTARQSRLCHCEGSEAISLHHSLFLVRHSIFTTTFTFLLLLFNIASPAQAKYGGGTGEPNDPYLIYDANHMNAIGADPCDWDKHFKLMADIDLSGFTGTEFNIIGTDFDNTFKGVFDGNGHKISNFTYTSTGTDYIGLFGYADDPNVEIKDLGLINPNIDAGTGSFAGSLVGVNLGTLTNCYAQDGSVSNSGASSYDGVGGLVGYNSGPMTNCYSTADVTSAYRVGGLVGWNNTGTISNCCAQGDSVSGNQYIGGLVGYNREGTITNCYSAPVVSGNFNVGGLVGGNRNGIITNCYSEGSVYGDRMYVGGLVGSTYYGKITNCYSIGGVAGELLVGGLVGQNEVGEITDSFWDTDTSGQSTSAGGTGLQTDEMLMQSTFTDVGWDFTTPVWTIDEGVDYPRLWWETPLLHAEPEVTLGTSNTISWDPVVGAVEYYAECSEDANFTGIVYSSGWITETSCEFTGLVLGKRYWYSVKVRNSAGTESQWSNVESSLQCSLADAVDIMLDPNNLKSENLKKTYINKINIAQNMIDRGVYTGALSKLKNDILPKTNGCAEIGEPDKSDWIITCEEQAAVYPLIIETIEHVRSLMQ